MEGFVLNDRFRGVHLWSLVYTGLESKSSETVPSRECTLGERGLSHDGQETGESREKGVCEKAKASADLLLLVRLHLLGFHSIMHPYIDYPFIGSSLHRSSTLRTAPGTIPPTYGPCWSVSDPNQNRSICGDFILAKLTPVGFF